MIFLIDCNVLISSVLTDGTCRSVFRWILRNHSILLSEAIALEHACVARRDRFKPFRSELMELIPQLCELATLVVPTDTDWNLPDPDDLKYLQAGRACSDTVQLVTGNQKDFPQKTYSNVFVLSPVDVQKKWILSQ